MLDVGLLAMTRAQLDARHCTHAGTPGFDPLALLGRMAVGIGNVSAVSTAGREKLLFAAICCGVWCTNMSQEN